MILSFVFSLIFSYLFEIEIEYFFFLLVFVFWICNFLNINPFLALIFILILTLLNFKNILLFPIFIFSHYENQIYFILARELFKFKIIDFYSFFIVISLLNLALVLKKNSKIVKLISLINFIFILSFIVFANSFVDYNKKEESQILILNKENIKIKNISISSYKYVINIENRTFNCYSYLDPEKLNRKNKIILILGNNKCYLK